MLIFLLNIVISYDEFLLNIVISYDEFLLNIVISYDEFLLNIVISFPFIFTCNNIQLLHFIECDMCYGAMKSNIDQNEVL